MFSMRGTGLAPGSRPAPVLLNVLNLFSDALDLEKIDNLLDDPSLAYLFFLLAPPIQSGRQHAAGHVCVPA